MEPGSLAKKPPQVLPLAMLALPTTVMPPWPASKPQPSLLHD
jgi:hypothetical protein